MTVDEKTGDEASSSYPVQNTTF